MKSASQAKRALFLLTAVNYFNYIDRYILAAVLVSIKKDLSLSDFQAGLLATAFMMPYMLTAPIFGWLGDSTSRSKLLGFGAGLWSIATFVTGMSKNFMTMMASRFTLGLGESAFTTVSVPFLSDFFSSEKRGRILAIFSSALPVGAALGYVLGGLLGASVGWRNAFFIVGFPGLILSVLLMRLQDPRKTQEHTGFSIKELTSVLRSSPSYLLATFGYCAYTFVVGGIAHWIPSFIQRTHGLSELSANTLFGGIAVGSGLFGTLAGGYLGDHLNKKASGGHLKISAISMLLALPFFWFCVQSEQLNIFVIFLALTQFCFFLSTSPINVALLHSVPYKHRNSAIALSIFACHMLGDALSSPLIGMYSDMTGSLKNGILMCTPVILIAVILWWIGANKTIQAEIH